MPREAFLFFVLVGCTAKDADSDNDQPSDTDLDGDGYEAPDDCDDADEAIHPDATETCDGIDNDCDGTADGPDATDASAWYVDEDGDGFGSGDATMACAPPTGTVSNDLDCDDTAPEIHPKATEVCDAADTDEDCDDFVDDADDSVDPATQASWYVDEDGDGYGTKKTVAACDAATGLAEAPGDCDDAVAETNPGSDEVCDDGIDNDCDGTAVGCGWVGEVTTEDAEAVVLGDTDYAMMGTDLAGPGDVDGDGTDDLLAGALGRAYLLTGPIADMFATDAQAILTGETKSDNAGAMNTGVGDQNVDGFDDFAVGAFLYAGTGRLYVVLGPVSGTHTIDEVATTVITGDALDGWFGYHPSSGDIDGDGVQDLVVGSPMSGSGPGAAYVYYGPLDEGEWSAADSDATITGTEFGSFTGSNTASADIDGDGVSDVLLTAPSATASKSYDGLAWLFYGPVSGAQTVDDADVRLQGDPSANFGYGLSAGGDLDGDGIHDVALGATAIGKVYVGYASTISGAATLDMSTKADATITGEHGSYLGWGVDISGDFDGDGNDDLAAGGPFWGDGAGKALLYHGPVAGSLDVKAADFTVTGTGMELTGTDVFLGADLDGSGSSDFVLSEQGSSPKGHTQAGAVSVWYGGGP